jgi:protein disulfide-isomerase
LLNTNIGEDDVGESIQDHLIKKYGPSASSRFMDPNSSMKQMARNVGIEFTDDRNVVSTVRPHAIMEYMKSTDKYGNDVANSFMEDLYKTYFVDGKSINDEALLIEMTNKYGMDAEETRRAMGPDHIKDVMLQDRQTKYKYRVSGVPYYMIYPTNDDNDSDGRPVAFSGAYPIEVIAEQLQVAAGED